MLVVLFILLAYGSAYRVHLLGAGKNHTGAHFHYKMSLPGTWPTTSVLEYYKCTEHDCNNTPFKSFSITNPNEPPGDLQIQHQHNIYDIECDSTCLENQAYKHIKVLLKIGTYSTGENIETCPDKLVNQDKCVDHCPWERRLEIDGVCEQTRILLLRESKLLRESNRRRLQAPMCYNSTAPVCSPAESGPCKCIRSCEIEVTMVSNYEHCDEAIVASDEAIFPIDTNYDTVITRLGQNYNVTNVTEAGSNVTQTIEKNGPFETIIGIGSMVNNLLEYIMAFDRVVLLSPPANVHTDRNYTQPAFIFPHNDVLKDSFTRVWNASSMAELDNFLEYNFVFEGNCSVRTSNKCEGVECNDGYYPHLYTNGEYDCVRCWKVISVENECFSCAAAKEKYDCGHKKLKDVYNQKCFLN